jgi:hypothetical protein
MQNKNALSLIQDLRDYFKNEYGIEVTVDIYAHSTRNNISGEKALSLALEIQPDLKCSVETCKGGDGRDWIKLKNVNNQSFGPVEMAIFAGGRIPEEQPADYPQTC